jgi:hypothetical protein
MAIFLESNKRSAYVQAETFCCLLRLKKSDLDSIKLNYPAVTKDIKSEAKRRAAETKEIVKAKKDQIFEEENDPDEERKDLERIYSTPKGIIKKVFSPQIFEETSKRSSFEFQSQLVKEDLTNPALKEPMRVKIELNNDEEDFSNPLVMNEEMGTRHYPNEDFSSLYDNRISKPLPMISNFTKNKEESSSKFSKINNLEMFSNKVIQEDVENEDKMSMSGSSESFEINKIKRNRKKNAINLLESSQNSELAYFAESGNLKPAVKNRYRMSVNLLPTDFGRLRGNHKFLIYQ